MPLAGAGRLTTGARRRPRSFPDSIHPDPTFKVGFDQTKTRKGCFLFRPVFEAGSRNKKQGKDRKVEKWVLGAGTGLPSQLPIPIFPLSRINETTKQNPETDIRSGGVPPLSHFSPVFICTGPSAPLYFSTHLFKPNPPTIIKSYLNPFISNTRK